MIDSIVVLLGLVAMLAGGTEQPGDGPQYGSGGKLMRPANYREWVWLSSGLGMSYGPLAQSEQDPNPPFDNVFVNPSAYRAFRQSGTWPDKTVLVLEVRASVGKGSIDQGGHFQGELRGIEVEVKDAGRWTFYGFNGAAELGSKIPSSASCYTCHAQNGAVDNTFVQFYPTLVEVAKQKGTLKSAE
jgi:hypothetical protein